MNALSSARDGAPQRLGNDTDAIARVKSGFLELLPHHRHRLDGDDTLDGQIRLVRQSTRKVVGRSLVTRD